VLEFPEEIKAKFRSRSGGPDSVKYLELVFYESGIDAVYPSNMLFPSDELYPADPGEPWLTIGPKRICLGSLTMTESLCSGNDLVWGSCEAAKFEVVVADIEDELVGREFTAYLTVGGYRIVFGMYTVTAVKKQADRTKRKITAYDRMVRFDVDVAEWYAATYPTDQTTRTVRELRDSLCAYCGVQQAHTELVNDDLVVGKTISPQTLAGRDVLKAICEINGVFGHIDRSGKLVYVRLQESGVYPSDTLYPSDSLYPQDGWLDAETLEYYRTITHEDYMVAGVDRLQIRMEEGDIGATATNGQGANGYVIEGNFLTYGLSSAQLTKLAKSILEQIGGREYRPAKISCYAMPWLEVGDGVRAITTDAKIVTYVLKRTIKGIQAMQDTIESKGSPQRSEVGTIESEIVQLKGKSAKIIKTVEEVSATVTDLEAQTSAQIKVVSDKIAAEVKRATDQDVELAGSISILAGQIEQKVSYNNLVASINLEANKAGSVITFKAGHFIFDGENFRVDAAGAGALAKGKFTWDSAGNLEATGLKLNGTANTSTIGANVINCNHLEVQDALECGSGMTVSGPATFNGYMYANRISCFSIYSEMAQSTWSDKRLKKGIRDISPETAREITLGLKSVSYRTKYSGTRSMGYVAQDVVELLHTLGVDLPLTDRYNGYLAIQYQNMIPLLSGTDQAQQKEIDELRRELKEIKEAIYGG
jgi:hypothetical protein